MARIRTIKPDFFRHEDLFDAEQEECLPLRLAYISLWTIADREGRFKWRPRTLKSDCLPYDEIDFSRVLDALCARGFIVRYEAGGEHYGCIPAFGKHQVINNREAKSEIPAPCENNILTREPRVDDATSTPLEQGAGEGKGRERKECTVAVASASENSDPSGGEDEPPAIDPKTELYRRGEQVLGKNSGGVVTKLLKSKSNSIGKARAALELASESNNAREYLGAIIRDREHKTQHELRDAGEAW